MSPSKTERKPGDKIKTDKRDACHIARLFRNGDITQVRIPPVLDVKEHAPPLATAHVETGIGVHNTGDVDDRAASGGCCVPSC